MIRNAEKSARAIATLEKIYELHGDLTRKLDLACRAVMDNKQMNIK